MKKYLLSLSILVFVIALIIVIAIGKLETWKQFVCWGLLGYFVLVTILTHIGLVRATKDRPQVFIRYYMSSTSLRLLAHLVVIVLFCMMNPPKAWFFIITFMIMYFLFTGFEVVYVLKGNKKTIK
jgi:hypothetical protein